MVSSQTFSPQDTIYGSIKTEGAGEGTLAVSWVRQGQALDKQTQIINATKPTWFAFHFIPPGGWPKGTFVFVFSLNGEEQHGRQFEIQ